MAVFQNANLINELAKELWGDTTPAVKDVSELIGLFGSIESPAAESFFNKLYSRIQKTILRTLDLDVDFPNILLSEGDYYGYVQKINVEPATAQEDNSWNVGNSTFKPSLFDIHKANISQSFVQNISSFTIDLTVPKVIYSNAFLNNTEMDSFIAAQFNSCESSLVMYINYLTHMCVSNLLAEKIKSDKEVKLLTMFNSVNGSTLTAEQAIYNTHFLQYAGMIIRNYIRYLNNPCKLYNDGSIVRSTSRDNMHILMLSDFVSAYTTYFTNNTLFKEMVELPYYNEVNYWHIDNDSGIPTFKSNSSINIIPASNDGDDTAVEASYVIGALIDKQAIGTTLMNDWSGVDMNNRDRYLNYTWGADRGFFNDLSENVVVFTIA